MQLKLIPNPKFWSTVQISLPGQAKTVPLQVEFKHKSRDELQKYFEGLKDKTDTDGLAEVVTDWKGVDAEYSEENLAVFLNNYPSASRSLYEAYRQELMEAKAKN